jgi:TatD DNase family protein
MFIDTHSHFYTEEFNADREEVIARAKKAGIDKMILPNIDSTSIRSLLKLTDSDPQYFIPLIGLHPTSVKEDFREELQIMEYWLHKRKFYGIGEIGIDLYWDKTFLNQQIEALEIQLDWAAQMKIPAVIHVRESFDEIIEVLRRKMNPDLNGIFHSFTGTSEQAKEIIDLGFKIGLGGIVTFKNSGLNLVVPEIPIEFIVLETDSPWLAPVPYRGKRNESAYIPLIANRIAELKQTSVEEVARITTDNAIQIFNL